MMALDRWFALGIVGVIIYVSISLRMRARIVEKPRILAGGAGRWQVAHFALSNETHIVVRKVLPDGTTVVDQHLVATVAENDEAYDVKFLEAMAQARQRLSLYESEEP